MAQKKKNEASDLPIAPDETAPFVSRPKAGEIFPNGLHFGIIQLARDLNPQPAAQRIVQWVNRDGALKAYVSENAYHRTELFTILDKLSRMAYDASIRRGGAYLMPVRTRIHWHEFKEDFLKGEPEALKPEHRVNPETDKPEEEIEIPIVL